MSNKPPIEVPQGAIRLNTDSQRLEFFAQDRWYEFATDSPILDGGARGVFNGGNNPSTVNTMEFVTISTQGNATDFGDMTTAKRGHGNCADRTRGLSGGGSTSNIIEFINFSSTGDSIDFGDRTVAEDYLAAVNNSTRGIFGGAWGPARSNTIDYVTIQSTGNATDFGDLTEAQQTDGSFCSPIRGFWVGGAAGPGPTYQATTTGTRIECITMATLGNAFIFGDLLNGTFGKVGASNSIRGLAGGGNPSIVALEKITMATLGNATNFGDLVNAHYYGAGGVSDPTRALFGGGYPNTNVISYVQIMTEGDALDFGDLTVTRHILSGMSNANGGL